MRRAGILGAVLVLVLAGLGGCTDGGEDASSADTTTSAAPSGEAAAEGAAPAGVAIVDEELTAGTQPAPVEEVVTEATVPVDLAGRSTRFRDPPVSGTPEEQLESLATFAIADLEDMWAGWFADNGFPEPPTTGWRVVMPDETFTSTCYQLGANNQPEPLVWAADTPNAAYCGSEPSVVDGERRTGTVSLPVYFLQAIYDGQVRAEGPLPEAAGDFSVAIVIAHEWGHSITHEISEQLQAPWPTGKYTELVADCFAGVWAAHAYHADLLEEGDLTEAVEVIEAAGDFQVSTPEGDPVLNHHGTPDERATALQAGYLGVSEGEAGAFEAGDPMACLAYYWREDPRFEADRAAD